LQEDEKGIFTRVLFLFFETGFMDSLMKHAKNEKKDRYNNVMRQ